MAVKTLYFFVNVDLYPAMKVPLKLVFFFVVTSSKHASLIINW